MSCDEPDILDLCTGSWMSETDNESSPVTVVSDEISEPRNNVKEGLEFLKSQLEKLEKNTAVRFEDLVPYSSTSR